VLSILLSTEFKATEMIGLQASLFMLNCGQTTAIETYPMSDLQQQHDQQTMNVLNFVKYIKHNIVHA